MVSICVVNTDLQKLMFFSLFAFIEKKYSDVSEQLRETRDDLFGATRFLVRSFILMFIILNGTFFILASLTLSPLHYESKQPVLSSQ